MRLSLLTENHAGRLAKIVRLDNSTSKTRAIDAILAVDPTMAKSFSVWLANLLNKGIIAVRNVNSAGPSTQIRLPEDSQRVKNALAQFERIRQRLPIQERDPMRFRDFYRLENVIEAAVQAGQASGGNVAVREVPGSTIVYNKPPYTVYKTNKIAKKQNGEDGKCLPCNKEDEQRINALQILGMGPPETSWCTRLAYQQNVAADKTYAANYLRKQPIYTVYKDGKPFMQGHGKDYSTDVRDHKMPFPPEIEPLIRKDQAADVAARRKAALEAMRDNPRYQVNPDVDKLIVTTIENNRIQCDRIVDSGKGFLYLVFGKGEGAAPRSGRLERLRKLKLVRPAPGLIRPAPGLRGKKYYCNLYDRLITINIDNIIDISDRSKIEKPEELFRGPVAAESTIARKSFAARLNEAMT